MKPQDLARFVPEVTRTQTLSWNSPCPFCKADSESTHHNHRDVDFYGKDRLVWFFKEGRQAVYCRIEKKRYSFSALAAVLGLTGIDSLIELEEVPQKEEAPNPLSELWEQWEIDVAHSQVKRQYWYDFGWSDEIIDRFQLGFGYLYNKNFPGHLIPMRPTNAETRSTTGLYYMSQRSEGHRGVKSRGSVKHYFWNIPATERPLKGCIVAEGEKDGITLAILFPNFDIIVSFGSNLWTREISYYLKRKKYKRVWVFGDNDKPGRIFSEQVYGWARQDGLLSKTLSWDSGTSVGQDVTDLLQDLGSEKTIAHIKQRLVEPDIDYEAGVTRPQHIENMPMLPVDTSNIYSVAELRGSGPDSIFYRVQEFLWGYKGLYKRGEGDLLLLAAPPGTGKTYTVRKLIEEYAKEHYELATKELAQMNNTLQSLLYRASQEDQEEVIAELSDKAEKLQIKINNFSFTSIAWVGLYVAGYTDLVDEYADPSLYYNHEARNKNNCMDYDFVRDLGEENHHIGYYCQKGCKYSETCKASGYLAQEEKMKAYPIVYYRHQQLKKIVNSTYKLVIVDESPTHIMDASDAIQIKSLRPFAPEWSSEILDPQQVLYLEALVSSLRILLHRNSEEPKSFEDYELNEEYIVSGSKFFTQLDEELRRKEKGFTLLNVLTELEDSTVEIYQPTFIEGERNNLGRRCVADIVKVLQRELDSYVEDPQNVNPSCIHLVGGTLEVFAASTLRVTSSTPVIVMDATALPDLYGAMFGRKVSVFSPDIKNPKAHTLIHTGQDFSISHIRRQIGKGYQKIEGTLSTVAGEIDPEDIPLSPNMFQSEALENIITLLVDIAKKHPKTLVVTHKMLSRTLRAIFSSSHKDWEYGHLKDKLVFSWYRALRGTNKYQDLEASVVIGTWRIPMDRAWLQIQMWAYFLGYFHDIPRQTVLKQGQFAGTDSGHGYRTFDDPFADRFWVNSVTSEMRQSAERIRAHVSDDPKYLYVYSDFPNSLLHVTELKKTNFLLRQLSDTHIQDVERDLLQEAHTYMEQFGEISFPSIRSSRKKWGVGTKTLMQLYAKLIPKLAKEYGENTIVQKYQTYL